MKSIVYKDQVYWCELATGLIEAGDFLLASDGDRVVLRASAGWVGTPVKDRTHGFVYRESKSIPVSPKKSSILEDTLIENRKLRLELSRAQHQLTGIKKYLECCTINLP